MWRVEERSGPQALESLVDEWHLLESRCRGVTPFQSPEWLIPWWTSFAHGELRAVTVRRDGLLCALLPLLIEPTGKGNRITLLGTGNTDHLDLLVDAQCREVATAMVMDAVAQSLSEGDWCDFEQLPASSSLMTTPAPFSWRWGCEQCDVCPTLILANCTGSEVIASRRAAEVRYAMRRLSRLGRVTLELVRRDGLEEALSALCSLHQARWEARDHAGVLGDDVVRRFLEQVTTSFHDRGLLRLYTLRLDGRIVAAHLGFQWRGRRFYYIGGFDPALRGLSIGTVLLAHAITDAANEGATEFDFLRGPEPYKYRWGASDQPSFRRTLRRVATG
jgi:CelD/BcsL family acetyltransferase involved in cellulose biosynthesis